MGPHILTVEELGSEENKKGFEEISMSGSFISQLGQLWRTFFVVPPILREGRFWNEFDLSLRSSPTYTVRSITLKPSANLLLLHCA